VYQSENGKWKKALEEETPVVSQNERERQECTILSRSVKIHLRKAVIQEKFGDAKAPEKTVFLHAFRLSPLPTQFWGRRKKGGEGVGTSAFIKLGHD